MHHIDAVAHPLIGDAAPEFLVQAEFAIHFRIKRAIGLGQQPFAPIRIFLADQLRFVTSAPSRSVVIPNHFHLADLAQDSGLHEVMRCSGIRFAAMLRAYLHNAVMLADSVSRRLRFA